MGQIEREVLVWKLYGEIEGKWPRDRFSWRMRCRWCAGSRGDEPGPADGAKDTTVGVEVADVAEADVRLAGGVTKP